MCSVEGCVNPGTTGTPDLCIKHKFDEGRSLRFGGLHTFKMAREGNYTQHELAADFRKDIVRRGRSEKIAYVGRERTPTEQWNSTTKRWEMTERGRNNAR